MFKLDPGKVLPAQENFRKLIRNGDVSDDALRFLEGTFLVPAGITPPHEDSLALLGSILIAPTRTVSILVAAQAL